MGVGAKSARACRGRGGARRHARAVPATRTPFVFPETPREIARAPGTSCDYRGKNADYELF